MSLIIVSFGGQANPKLPNKSIIQEYAIKMAPKSLCTTIDKQSPGKSQHTASPPIVQKRQASGIMGPPGQHGSDTWDFIDIALKTSNVSRVLTHLKVYYFMMQCKAHSEVDAVINIFWKMVSSLSQLIHSPTHDGSAERH